MRNALILHGTAANPHSNWFDWLKQQLEGSGYKVWVPQLPNADKPDMQTYRKFIFASDWEFNEESLIIGHSSGAVAVLSILEEMPTIPIDTAVMVGVYRPELASYSVGGAIDTDKVKGKAKRFVFVHSDNDPYCPLDHAKYFAENLGGELKVILGQDHFSYELNPKHDKLPELIEVLDLNSGGAKT